MVRPRGWDPGGGAFKKLPELTCRGGGNAAACPARQPRRDAGAGGGVRAARPLTSSTRAARRLETRETPRARRVTGQGAPGQARIRFLGFGLKEKMRASSRRRRRPLSPVTTARERWGKAAKPTHSVARKAVRGCGRGTFPPILQQTDVFCAVFPKGCLTFLLHTSRK